MRKIIHVDMDAFFAAVEMRDNPKLVNVPMAIGGGERGVISTCNYKAREFGVRSAMPTSMAKKLCPGIKFVKPNFSKYKEASLEVHEIFEQYTSLIEPVSIDEAYLDVGHSELFFNSATLLAQKIRDDIFKKTKLTASAGIAPNKLLAKIASDYRKPNGQFTVAPHEVEDFIKGVELKKIWGVGRVLNEKFLSHKISTCGDLQNLSLIEINDICGRFGDVLHQFCRGIDEREVVTQYERKSVGVERTFLKDLSSIDVMRSKLSELIDELKNDLGRHPDRRIKSVQVKIKYNDFKSTTIERHGAFCESVFFELFESRYFEDVRPVRLLGVGVKFYSSDSTESQLSFPIEFDE